MNRFLSEEFQESNIQVNAVDPGVMDTKMQADIRRIDKKVIGERLHRRFHDLYKDKKLETPDKVARMPVFLASRDADHLTGHILNSQDDQH